MKNFIYSLVAMLMLFTTTSFAQGSAIIGNKPTDNIYVGFAAGAETNTMKYENGAFRAFDPTATILVGKNFTPIFGIRAEGVARFNSHGADISKCKWAKGTFVKAIDINLLSTWNIGNIVSGYKGEPRKVEFIALYGFGWAHSISDSYNRLNSNAPFTKNSLISKAGLDIALNIGKQKNLQVIIEPSITYAMNGESPMKYNLSKSWLDLKAGIIYKFKTSNGTHNFTNAKLYDQSEVDALNQVISQLRDSLANAKPKIVEVEKIVNTPTVTKSTVVNFAQNSSELTDSAKEMLDEISSNTSVTIVGTTSPEGTSERNSTLSQERADAVAKYLSSRNVTVKSVKGGDAGRTAIITVE